MIPTLRVAAVMDTWAVSGPGRQIAALSAALRSERVELRLFVFQRIDRERAPFFTYLDQAGVGYQVTHERGAFDIAAWRELGRSLRAFQPHIVQSHHYKPTAFVLAHRAFGFRPPWISFFHGDTTENARMRVYNAIHTRMVPLADRLIVLSEEHRAKFAAASERVRLVPNAVLDLPVEGPLIDVRGYRRPGIPVIAALARLSHEKGVDLLIEAVGRLHGMGKPVTLVVAGNGPERSALEAQARRLGLDEQVHFIGFTSNVIPLYQQFDLVVLPSREGAEGMPNVLLEALRTDVPVVATRVAAVPEVLADPDAGEIAQPGDVDDLVRAIGKALENGRSAAAKAARAATVERYSLSQRVNAHLGIYRELIPDFV